MSVAVYPRLEEVLRERNLSITELKQQIEDHYGLVLTADTLSELTGNQPMRHADMTAVGAAATILGVELGDLFAIKADPIKANVLATESYLDPEQARRMAHLFDLQSTGQMGKAELQELGSLIDEYGRRFQEQSEAEFAQKHGISVDKVRAEADAQLAEVSKRWEWINANPQRRRAYIEHLKRQKVASNHNGDATTNSGFTVAPEMKTP